MITIRRRSRSHLRVCLICGNVWHAYPLRLPDRCARCRSIHWRKGRVQIDRGLAHERLLLRYVFGPAIWDRDDAQKWHTMLVIDMLRSLLQDG